MNRDSRKLVIAVLLALVPVVSFAHTALKESTPAADSTVNTVPDSIQLVFTAPVRLARVQVLRDGQALVTDFRPQSEPLATYLIKAQGMAAGSFTVNWAAIGADGHTASNSFSFVVEPTAASASP